MTAEAGSSALMRPLARIDPVGALRHALLVAAFCLAIAAIQIAFLPERPYGPPAAYSLSIGLIIWAVVDLGRHFFPSAAETGWPPGLTGVALVVAGIAAGFVLGNLLGDLICRSFNLYAGSPPLDRDTELRHGLLITVMAGVVGSFYFYAVNRGLYLEAKMAEARQQAAQARLKVLETQLEPHMLFNTLANLRVLIGTDPPRAQDMLDRMIAYLRATLAASRATTHPLRAEFDRLRDYLELMTVRMGPRLRYRLDLPDDLAGEAVPTLLLQPLVENAIRHGLEPKVEGGEIAVRAWRTPGQMHLEVADTGVGLKGAIDTGQSAGGFGLAQVRERLVTAYGTDAAMTFIAQPQGGVRVTIDFPSENG